AHVYRKQKNYEEAIKTFKKAGELGESEAYFSLGVFYDKEEKFKDDKKSYKYFSKCYEMGLGECAGAIGQSYEEDYKDYEKAIEWYKKGFELGNKASVNRLGYLYWEKLKDYDEAINILKDGYKKLNCIFCLSFIGDIYATSLKNYEEALVWYKKAHKKGYVDSTYNIAYTYQHDLKDKEKAIQWYKKAVDLGDIGAKEKLKELGINYEK
ncbi:tetratricopeptide repeat protein, partial [Malaciobacter sp. WC5094]